MFGVNKPNNCRVKNPRSFQWRKIQEVVNPQAFIISSRSICRAGSAIVYYYKRGIKLNPSRCIYGRIVERFWTFASHDSIPSEERDAATA